MINKNKLSILQCPMCKSDIAQDGDYLVCVSCQAKFPYIDGIAVFLTKDNLSEFMGETWGSEVQKENADAYPGFTFVSNEHPIEDIRRIHKEATEEGKALRLYKTGVFPQDPDQPQDFNAAIEKSCVDIAELARAGSAARILDWPTGWGFNIQHLTKSVSPETLIVALEINFRTLAKIKPYYDKYGFSENMLFVVADARKMPFKDNTFQAVTAWGGTTEIANSEAGCKETFRVLEQNGSFGISGDQYKEDSPSMEIAERNGMGSLVTKQRLEAAMQRIGFKNMAYKVLYEGHDTDTEEVPDEDRCPLPARGDWFQHIVASVQK